MKFVAVLIVGMLLGALVHREAGCWNKPLPGTQASAPCAQATALRSTDAAPRSPDAIPPDAIPQSSTVVAPVARTPAETIAPAPEPSSASETAAPALDLLIPVQGKTAADLVDTFTDARSQGRSHDAIDIMANAGTPVLAVADGQVEKLFDSVRGGLTIYQFEPSGKYAYYYAHLQRYADGLAEKQPIKRGQVIGYVGSTGNASPDAPHLHFAIFVLGPERHWWEGEAINPYPILARR